MQLLRQRRDFANDHERRRFHLRHATGLFQFGQRREHHALFGARPRSHPDFHIVCISVDPENDKKEKLADYAQALGAESKNWWFLNAGEAKATHDYLEKELKFFGIRERKDPADIEANGRYAHDLGFLLVDREYRVIGKWPLADARSEEARKRDPQLYQKLKDELFQRIHEELEKNETPGI